MSTVTAEGLIDVPGAKLFYKTRGTGPVLLTLQGELSGGSLPCQCAQALARQLGRPLAEFPGGHSGYAQRPRAFADALHHALTQEGAAGQHGSEDDRV